MLKTIGFLFQSGEDKVAQIPFYGRTQPLLHFLGIDVFSFFEIESLHHSSYHARRRKDTCASRLQACNRKFAFSVQTVAESLPGHTGWLVSRDHLFLLESVLFRRPGISLSYTCSTIEHIHRLLDAGKVRSRIHGLGGT